MVNNSGLISGLVAQSELTQLLDEIYGENNYLFDALYKIHDLAFMRRRRVIQESCAHTSPVEVEQVQGLNGTFSAHFGLRTPAKSMVKRCSYPFSDSFSRILGEERQHASP